jgi:hypothetical protein
VKLEGSLDAFGLADVLNLLHATRKSGALCLDRGSRSAVVNLVDGDIAGAFSDTTGRLGVLRRLVARGLVTEEAVADAAVAAADTGDGLVSTLVASGAADADVVHDITLAHALDVLFELVRWDDGDFSFVAEERPSDDVGVRAAPSDLVESAARRIPAWDNAARQIPGPDRVLRVLPTESSVEIEPDAWNLLTLVDGRRTVNDLVMLSGLGAFTVVTRLAELVDRGLVVAGIPDDPEDPIRARRAVLAMLDAAEGLEAGGDDGDLEPDVHGEDGSTAHDEARDTDQVAESGSDQGHGDSSTTTVVAHDLPTEPTGTVVTVPVEASTPVPQSEASSTRETAAPSASLLGGAHVPGDVVPPRPEPFLPSRTPDHHDQPAPGSTMRVIGANAMVAQPVEALDDSEGNDPMAPINRSMVLRLIAGVRGL